MGDPEAATAAVPAQVTFTVLKCGCTVPVTEDGKKPNPCARAAKQKPLLHDVSASVKGGEMMAVLGPSGAGKSTLLNMLALESKGNAVASGSVTLNGKPFTKELFSRFAVSLPQHDRCWAMLTCREHVSLAVDLSVVLYYYGTCVSYLILIGGTLTQLLRSASTAHVFAAAAAEAPHHALWLWVWRSGGEVLLSLFVIFIILPLSCAPSIDKLGSSSPCVMLFDGILCIAKQ